MHMSAFRGKADMPLRECPLLRSLLVKRTCARSLGVTLWNSFTGHQRWLKSCQYCCYGRRCGKGRVYGSSQRGLGDGSNVNSGKGR